MTENEISQDQNRSSELFLTRLKLLQNLSQDQKYHFCAISKDSKGHRDPRGLGYIR